MSTSMADASYITKFGHVAVYSKGHQKSRETTREIWRSEGELVL